MNQRRIYVVTDASLTSRAFADPQDALTAVMRCAPRATSDSPARAVRLRTPESLGHAVSLCEALELLKSGETVAVHRAKEALPCVWVGPVAVPPDAEGEQTVEAHLRAALFMLGEGRSRER